MQFHGPQVIQETLGHRKDASQVFCSPLAFCPWPRHLFQTGFWATNLAKTTWYVLAKNNMTEWVVCEVQDLLVPERWEIGVRVTYSPFFQRTFLFVFSLPEMLFYLLMLSKSLHQCPRMSNQCLLTKFMLRGISPSSQKTKNKTKNPSDGSDARL